MISGKCLDPVCVLFSAADIVRIKDHVASFDHIMGFVENKKTSPRWYNQTEVIHTVIICTLETNTNCILSKH